MKNTSVWWVAHVWCLCALLSACLLELACAIGWLSAGVLGEVVGGVDGWWSGPAWWHVVAALLIGTVIYGVATVLARPHAPNRWRLIPDGPPADRLVWGLFAILIAVAYYNQFEEMKKVVAGVTDFGMFYDAATALRSGGDPYRATDGGYFYPPTFAYYFRLLTWLPRAGASLLWFTAKLSLLVWTFHAVYRLVGRDVTSEGRKRWLVVGMVAVAARFLFADLQYGNTNVFVLWLVVAAVVFDLSGRPARSGLTLAAAASVKVVPAVFALYFLARRRWRAVAWAIVAALALNLVPFVLDGRTAWETWASYVGTGVAGKLNDTLAQPDNQSLWGFASRSFDLPLAQTRLIWGLLSVALAATAVWSAHSLRRPDEARQATAASLFFLLWLLVSPGSWVVHYVAVLLPMTVLLRRLMDESFRMSGALVVFILANVAFTVSGWFRATVGWSINQSWFVVAALMLFVTLSISSIGSDPIAGRPTDGDSSR